MCRLNEGDDCRSSVSLSLSLSFTVPFDFSRCQGCAFCRRRLDSTSSGVIDFFGSAPPPYFGEGGEQVTMRNANRACVYMCVRASKTLGAQSNYIR